MRERWQPILFRILGRWVPSRLSPGLCSAHGHLLELSKSQMVPISDLCQEGFSQAAWTKATVSSRLIKAQAPPTQHPCPTELQPCPAQHPVCSTMARRHVPSPSPKRTLLEPQKGVKRDLPAGEFSITSAW